MGGDSKVALLTASEAETLKVGIALVTANQETPTSEFQIQPLLAVAGRSRSHLWHFLDILGRRLFACPAWLANSKGLLILHKMMRRSSAELEAELANMLSSSSSSRRSPPMLDLKALASSFRDKDSGASQDHSAFVRMYAQYLAERVACSQSVSFASNARGAAAGGEAHWAGRPVEEILKQARALQKLLRALLAVRPPARVTFCSGAVQEALELILLDTFEVYSAINFALIELVERFGSMPGEQAFEALAVYRCAAKQAEGLAGLYQQYGEMGVGKGVQFPSVAIMGESYLQSLEQYVSEAAAPPARSQHVNGSSRRLPPPAQRQPQPAARASPAAAPLPSLLPDANLSLNEAVKAAADEQFASTALALFSDGDDGTAASPDFLGLPPLSSPSSPLPAPGAATWRQDEAAAAPSPLPGNRENQTGAFNGPATPSPPSSPLPSYLYSSPHPPGQQGLQSNSPGGGPMEIQHNVPLQIPLPPAVPAQQPGWYPPTPPPSLASPQSSHVGGPAGGAFPHAQAYAMGLFAPMAPSASPDRQVATGAWGQLAVIPAGGPQSLPAASGVAPREDPATFGWELALDASVSRKVEPRPERRGGRGGGEATGDRQLAPGPPSPAAAGALAVVPYAPQGPTMARGFDQFLLDSMYEAAQAQRQIYSAAYRVHMQAQAKRDPFEASAGFEPPSYVQMAQRAQQQLAMYFEQRLMAQHAHFSSRMHGLTGLELGKPANGFPFSDLRCRNPDGVGVRYGGNVLVPYS